MTSKNIVNVIWDEVEQDFWEEESEDDNGDGKP